MSIDNFMSTSDWLSKTCDKPENPQEPVNIPNCPLCGKKADHWYIDNMLRAGCSDDKCPCAFGGDGINITTWCHRP